MKRLPLVLTLVALVALAASIAYWILQLYQPPQRPIAAAPLVEAPVPSMDAAATLFGGQAQVATNYQLTGVISAGAQSVAIIAANGAPAKALMVGKELAPGVTVSEVHARYVMLSDGGVMKRIDLPADAKAGTALGGAPAPTPQQEAGIAPPAPPPPEGSDAGRAADVHEEPMPPTPAEPAPPPPVEPAPAPVAQAPAPAAGVANPPVSAGAVPGAAPAQMPSPTRSQASPVSQPPTSR